MSLKQLQPVAPPISVCETGHETATTKAVTPQPTTGKLFYILPSSPPESLSKTKAPMAAYRYRATTAPDFATYHKDIHAIVQKKLPPALYQDKVTQALVNFMAATSGQAQLTSLIANHAVSDEKTIATEQQTIQQHSAPYKLKYGDVKKFAEIFFNLQLKINPAVAAQSKVDDAALKGLSAEQNKLVNDHQTFDANLLEYLHIYYSGKFYDRMGTAVAAPQISTTIPDSEIAAAETVLLEFLIDTIDPTPVMGDSDPVTGNTVFYPGNSKNQPTAYTVFGRYIQIEAPPSDPSKYPCGITTANAWVLKDLANAASNEAAAVGGLVANTPGGISIGLGVLGKISIGDNQTLSTIVKTAASRLALRAALASSYATLQHVKFDVSEPGGGGSK
jgi:hypothetical protein